MIGLIYRLCSLVCHQLPERTFCLGNAFLPLCARCSGIYSGFLLGLLFQITGRKRKGKEFPPPSITLIALLFILLMAVNAYLAKGGNYPRFASGLLAGSSISIFLLAVWNYLFQREGGDFSAIDNWKRYLSLLGLILLFSATYFIRTTFTFFLLGLISVLGLILLYLLLAALVSKRLGQYSRNLLTGKGEKGV